VCAGLSDEATLARELRALSAAGGEHPRAVRRLLVLDRDSVPRTGTPEVLVQPAYEWLLAATDER
jgi:hypothetical protein